MMNINPTQAIRNVWLVELFENNADGLTLQEIIDEYQFRPPQLGNNVNPSQVSERTIHNWLKEIEEIFHVKISCGRGKRTYNIESDDYLDNPLLNLARQIKSAYDKYVVMGYQYHKKSGKTKYGELFNCFMQVGNSMLIGESIAIRYGKEHQTIDFNEPCIFSPFFTKVIENECYVIGAIKPVSGLWNEKIEVYSLDRLSLIKDGTIPTENYTIPENFTPTDYYECGVSILDKKRYNSKYENTLMVVFLNANNDTADYLREHPLAPTQTEIESNRTNNKNIFMVIVKPNEDFFTQILSFGEELTITNPDFLRRKGENNDDRTRKDFGYHRYEEDLIGYDYSFLSTINKLKRGEMGMNMLLQSKYGGLTDAQLVAKYKQGEEGGFDFLYNKYRRKTLNYLYNLASEKYDAQHLNSIVWEKVFLALLKGQYQASEPFENWVKVIAKRTFLNWCKEKKRELPIASFDYDDSVFQEVDEGPERALEDKENIEILNRLIKDLPPKLRRVLELDREGYSHREIAEMEGITEQMVKRRYRSAARAIIGMTY